MTLGGPYREKRNSGEHWVALHRRLVQLDDKIVLQVRVVFKKLLIKEMRRIMVVSWNSRGRHDRAWELDVEIQTLLDEGTTLAGQKIDW